MNHKDVSYKEKFYPNSFAIMYKKFYLRGFLHREDGPSITNYRRDGSINMEYFHLFGEFLGYDKIGFWVFWDRLNEERRRHPNVLRLLLRYS